MISKKITWHCIGMGISYIFLWWAFADFKQINSLYSIRLLFPTILLYALIKLSYVFLHKLYLTKNKAVFIVFAINIMGTWILLISAFVNPVIQYDTWQVFDMSKYILFDFGRMDMIRQHIVNSPYTMAFPPLFPSAMAIINLIFNFGVFSSVIVSFFALFIIVFVMGKFAAHFKYPLPVALGVSIFIFNDEIIPCVMGGSTILLSAMIFVISLYVLFLKNDLSIKSVVLIALLSGLGVMTRFDYLPIAIVMVFICFILKGKMIFAALATYTLVFLATISPWIIYSQLRFGSWFITDNGRRIWSIPDVRPSTFFPESLPAQTISDNFGLWLIESIKRWYVALKGFIFVTTENTILFSLCLMGLICFVIYTVSYFKTYRNNIQTSSKKPFNKTRSFLTAQFSKLTSSIIKSSICLLAIAGQFAACILTGYPDERYYVMGISFYMTIALILLSRYLFGTIKTIKSDILISALVIGNLLIGFLTIGELSIRTILNPSSKISEYIVLVEGYEIKQVIDENRNGSEQGRIILYRRENSIDVPRWAALADEVSILSPSNISADNALFFVETFEMEYIYSSDFEFLSYFTDASCMLEKTSVEYLYKIDIH